jgi:uncharacterized LabA/DUF88 family protein
MQLGIYVDVSNMYYCLRKRFGRHLDYSKYREFCLDLGTLTRCVAYGAYSGAEAKAFIHALQKQGWETKFKHLKTFRNGKQKADWDVGMYDDMLAPRMGKIVLGSADGDMAPAVRRLRDMGSVVVVLACGVSRELRAVADTVIEIPESLLEDA